MASCPKCKNRSLSPTLLADGLPAKACKACGGTLVDLLAYRAWAEQSGIDAANSSGRSEAEVDDTSQAISCPHCGAVMTKFRLSASAANRLDFCSNCDEAWLDRGEWKQLEDMGLRRSLGSVFTEPWQRHVREEIAEHSRESALRQRFGADFERISEFRSWAQGHPRYEFILAWLRDRGES